MADKEVIIDGVNVAGCEDYGYRGKAGYWCHYYDEPCTDCPNCYYKQLQRKEQELLNLSSIIRKTPEYSDTCSECADEILIYPSISGKNDYTQNEVEQRSLQLIVNNIQRLQAENEELKAFKEKLMRPVILPMQDEPETINKADRYKQALEDIKNFLSEIIDETCAKESNELEKCKVFKVTNRILKIILCSEVQNDQPNRVRIRSPQNYGGKN